MIITLSPSAFSFTLCTKALSVPPLATRSRLFSSFILSFISRFLCLLRLSWVSIALSPGNLHFLPSWCAASATLLQHTRNIYISQLGGVTPRTFATHVYIKIRLNPLNQRAKTTAHIWEWRKLIMGLCYSCVKTSFWTTFFYFFFIKLK